MKALILAAGRGERLIPITDTLPKPMIPIAGKPLLHHLIDTLRENGITDIIIVIGYMADRIRDYFDDGSNFGVNIQYIPQLQPSGVGDAILLAKPYLSDPFLLCYSDVVLHPELIHRMLDIYSTQKVEAAVAVTLVEHPKFYGVAELDEEFHITKFIEKPAETATLSHYATAGCYIFTENFTKILEKEKKMELALQKLITQNPNIQGVLWEREWAEITWPWDLIVANRLLLDQMTERDRSITISVNANVSEHATIEGPVWISDNAVIRAGAQLTGPVFIGENSYIGNNSLIRDHATIDSNVKIGFGVEVKNSLIFSGSFIDRLSYIGDSLIGEKVHIGSGTQTWTLYPTGEPIIFNYNEREIKVPLEKFGAIVGPYCKIGINASIHPGKVIGTGSIINAGAIIDKNVERNTIVSVTQHLTFEKKK